MYANSIHNFGVAFYNYHETADYYLTLLHYNEPLVLSRFP